MIDLDPTNASNGQVEARRMEGNRLQVGLSRVPELLLKLAVRFDELTLASVIIPNSDC